MQTIISKWGNSQGVRLSKELLKSANMTVDDTVIVEAEENVIILKKATPKKKITLEELFNDYDGPLPEPYDWGEPTGREVW